MKKFTLKYGSSEVEIELPDSAKVLQPRKEPVKEDEAEIVSKSLDNPIESPKLEKFIKPDDTVAIVIPDKTRKARVDFLLDFVIKRMPTEKIVILFANGTHMAQTESEKLKIIGRKYYEKFKVFENDAFRKDDKVYVGKTTRGTNVILNKIVKEVDKVLIIGAVTHHYFAGFGGGPKMIVPGVSAYQTAVENHRLTLTEDGDINPNASNLKLDGNPVYEDIVEAFKISGLKATFLGVVLDENDRIIFSTYGDVISSHRAGAEFVGKNLVIPIENKFDVIVASAGGYPKDVNFIQSHKTIHHASYAVRKGGTIVALIECRDGIGSKTFLDWFKFKNIDDLKANLLKNYTMNGHTALSLRKKLENIKIITVTELNPETVKLLGLIKVRNIDELRLGGSVGIIENASLYLPISN